MAKGPPTLARVSVGTSGWSYPTWRPGFYPAGSDPATFLAVLAVLVTVALAATLGPALRAVRVDPVIALRYE